MDELVMFRRARSSGMADEMMKLAMGGKLLKGGFRALKAGETAAETTARQTFNAVGQRARDALRPKLRATAMAKSVMKSRPGTPATRGAGRMIRNANAGKGNMVRPTLKQHTLKPGAKIIPGTKPSLIARARDAAKAGRSPNFLKK